MPVVRKIKEFYVNVPHNKLIDSSGVASSSDLVLYRGTQYVLEIHCMREDGTTVLDLPTVDVTWQGAIDSDVTRDKADLATSLDAVFNVSGEFNSGTANPALGELSMQLNTNTAAFKTDLADESSKNGYFEVWMQNSGTWTMVFQIGVILANISHEPAAPSPSVPPVEVGTEALGSGVSSGTVTLTGWSAAPTRIDLQIEADDGTGAVLFAVWHTATSAQFEFMMNGNTPDANHKLHWWAY
jgi:hypothetical protein